MITGFNDCFGKTVLLKAFCVWKAFLVFPWWLWNDLHLLFINIVSFQGYGFSENTISGTLVADSSLRSPPGFSPMVLSTIEGSHGWDNDSGWSFHERTHHVDRLHTAILIFYPGRHGLTRLNLFQQNFTGRVDFLQRHNDTVAVPLVASQQLWTVGRWTEKLRRCSAGLGFVVGPLMRPSNVELDLDLETFPCRAATTAVSTSIVIVYDFLADWWAGWNEKQNGVLELQNDEDHIWGLQDLFWQNVIWWILSLMHYIFWHLDFC